MRSEDIEIIISNRRFTLYTNGRIEVYDYKLANRINDVLNHYPDYRFKKGIDEEPVFLIPGNEQGQIVYNLIGYIAPNRRVGST